MRTIKHGVLMKQRDVLSLVILIVGGILTAFFSIWVICLNWSSNFCETIDCLNNYFFEVLKVPLGIVTATIASYSARMLHVRFIQTEKQIQLTLDNNTANNFFMHKKALSELCSHLEEVHNVEINAESVYRLLFPENSPHNMKFTSDISKEKMIHPFIKAKEAFEAKEVSSKLINQLVIDSFIFQSTLKVKPREGSNNSQLELPREFAIYGFENTKAVSVTTTQGNLADIIDKPFKFTLLDKSWGSSENKLNLIANAYAKFAGIDLSEKILSDRLAGFSFLDASLPKMQGIKLVTFEEKDKPE